MSRTLVALILLFLTGCVLGNVGNAAKLIGQPESALYKALGAPDRQITAPSGATVDVYTMRSLNGENVLCKISFFVRQNEIVGYSARGSAVNCGGKGGLVD
jgi:hypothetical protein